MAKKIYCEIMERIGKTTEFKKHNDVCPFRFSCKEVNSKKCKNTYEWYNEE